MSRKIVLKRPKKNTFPSPLCLSCFCFLSNSFCRVFCFRIYLWNCESIFFVLPGDVSVVFVPREKASIFLSYNECVRRMNCGTSRKEECSEECAVGKLKRKRLKFFCVFSFSFEKQKRTLPINSFYSSRKYRRRNGRIHGNFRTYRRISIDNKEIISSQDK